VLASTGATSISITIPPSNVAAKSLTISGLTAESKVYNGKTDDVRLAGKAALFGKIGTDDVALTGRAVGTFATKNAGTGRLVTVSGLSLTGKSAGNYKLMPLTLSADITPASLDVRADNKTRLVNTANPLLTATITGLAAGETVATALQGSAALSTAASTTSAVGGYLISVRRGTLAAREGNYVFKSFVPGSLTVATTPGIPTGLRGTPGNGRVTLSWVPPANNGGTPVTDYIVQYRLTNASTWKTSPDAVSATASAVVTGLSNDRSYFFRVLAKNVVADSIRWSAISAEITPKA